MMERYVQLTKQADYLNFIASPFKDRVVADDVTIAANSVAYNATFGVFRINDSSDTLKGALEIPIGYLYVGDKVDITLDIMNKSGVKAKIALDYSTTGLPPGNFGALFTLQSEKADEFESLGGSFISTKASFGIVVIGTFTPDIGDFYIRDVQIKVTTKGTTYGTARNPATRHYTFNGNGSGFTLKTENGIDVCSYTINSVAKEMIVTHNNPFTVNKNGVVMWGMSATSPMKYLIKAKSQSRNGFKLMFYDMDTKETIDPAVIAALGTGMWFSVVHHGFDG